MKIEISNGELLDKLSILEIKLEKITDVSKLENVKKEHVILWEASEELLNHVEVIELYKKLVKVNTELWEIEDRIRERERNEAFDGRFIELARLVYHTNDKRSVIKKELNLLTGSELVEEKSYSEY